MKAFNLIRLKKSNMSMLERLEEQYQEKEDYHRLEQLTELAPGNVYQFSFGGKEMTLNYEEDEQRTVTYISQSDAVYLKAYKEDRVLVYNQANLSYLLISGRMWENDALGTCIYRFDQNGIEQCGECVGKVDVFTRNAFAAVLLCEHQMYHEATQWMFLQDGFKWESKGKLADALPPKKVIKEFKCYVVEGNGVREVDIQPGETITLYSSFYDYDDELKFVEFRRDEQSLYYPVVSFNNYCGLTDNFEKRY